MSDRSPPVVADPSAGSRASDPFSCWRVRHDPHSRQALVDEFMPVVRHLADRYRSGTQPLNDLLHLAMVGLLNAIDRFDPDPFVAMSNAITNIGIDEIIISTLPARVSRWLHRDLPHRAEELGLPVTVVTAQQSERAVSERS